MVLFASCGVVAGKLLEQSPLCIGKPPWKLNRHGDFLIAASHGIPELWNALVRHGEHRPRLRPGWKLQFRGSIDRIDFNRITENGLEVTHLDFGENVEAIALQPGVRFDGEKHVEITGGTTPGTGISFAGNP